MGVYRGIHTSHTSAIPLLRTRANTSVVYTRDICTARRTYVRHMRKVDLTEGVQNPDNKSGVKRSRAYVTHRRGSPRIPLFRRYTNGTSPPPPLDCTEYNRRERKKSISHRNRDEERGNDACETLANGWETLR